MEVWREQRTGEDVEYTLTVETSIWGFKATAEAAYYEGEGTIVTLTDHARPDQDDAIAWAKRMGAWLQEQHALLDSIA